MFKKFIISTSSLAVILSVLFIPTNNIDNHIFPIQDSYVITSYYGYRMLYNKQNFHNGIDIASKVYANVYSSSSGIVSYIGFDKTGFGNYIIITNNEYKYIYAHLSSTHQVSRGDYIHTGMHISNIGPKFLENGLSNGNTTGAHLHFEIRINNKSVNPFSIIKKEEV